MSYWVYYLIGAALLLHPHLKQKLDMLWDYFTHPEYEFWTTFSGMDVFDLFLHAFLPVVFIVIGIRKQRTQKNV